MGAILGLWCGLGLCLILIPAAPPATKRTSALRLRLDRAGLGPVTPLRLVGSAVALGAIAFIALAALSQSLVIALAFALLATYLPFALVRLRLRQRQTVLRELWPEVVDNLASAIRAGLALPEALSRLADTGPEPIRPHFREFNQAYRGSGNFTDALDQLKRSLADPVGDRIVESLRVAREVGGSDLGRLLRTLSAFLRDDARTRAELEARQSWTVNAARLAVAAPWLLLALLSLRPEAVAAYDSATGAVILGCGAAACFVAYRLMLRIGRLPTETRVLG